MEKQLPQPGWRYRHFKGGRYQIVTLALNTETGEDMVVYQALYDDFKVYVRPLSMFLSETDFVKALHKKALPSCGQYAQRKGGLCI